MARQPNPDILDERIVFSLHQVCRSCGADSGFVVELVEEGVVRPRAGETVRDWEFDGIQLTRIHKAYRLYRELHVNLPGIALALDLLDRLAQRR